MRYASTLSAFLLLAAPALGAEAKVKASPAFPSDLQQAVDAVSAPAAGEETWTQRKNAQGEIVHIRCTATQCDMPLTCPQAGPPCLAQAQKKKEEPPRQEAPAAPAVSAAPSDGQPPENVAGTVVDDILDGQPENSLTVPEDALSEPPAADWSGLDILKETIEEETPLKKGGAVEQARRMRKEALQTETRFQQSSPLLDPAYRNSPLFRQGAQNLTSSE